MNSINSRNWNRLFAVATRGILAAGAACLMLLIPATARADSTQTYNVTGTLASGQTVSGTVTLDFTTGKVTTGPGGITVGAEDFSCPGVAGCIITNSIPGTDVFALFNTSHNYIAFNFNALSGSLPPSPFLINAGNSYCQNCGVVTGNSYFTSITMTPINAPEPSEGLLLLAGLGALGAFVVVRRKPATNSPPV